jgi:hypothetical protein
VQCYESGTDSFAEIVTGHSAFSALLAEAAAPLARVTVQHKERLATCVGYAKLARRIIGISNGAGPNRPFASAVIITMAVREEIEAGKDASEVFHGFVQSEREKLDHAGQETFAAALGVLAQKPVLRVL